MSQDHLPQREFEMLSAYLDGELSPRQIRKLEARLRAEPRFQRELTFLRSLSSSMRALPQASPPRSLILTPEMVEIEAPRAGYPALRLATALAAFVFVAVLGVDLLSSRFSGAVPARSLDQVMAEAPAAMESDMADAAKSEVAELEAEGGEVEGDRMAGAEVPAEAPAEEAMALAEPSAEGETAMEDGVLGEAEPDVEAQVVAPEQTLSAQDELLPSYSATEVPEADMAANQTEPVPEPIAEAIPSALGRLSPSVLWLRGIEAGLALLTIVLGALALRARKRSP